MVAGRDHGSFGWRSIVLGSGAALTDRRSGIELLEEAIALLRHAPARAWTWYLFGAIPFFAAALFFVRATTGTLAVPDPAAGSFVLALLFGWRQAARSMFGRILTAEIAGVQSQVDIHMWLRAAARTWFAGCVRIVLILPVPYLSMLFRNYQAYAWDEETPFRRAASMSARGGNPTVAWLTLFAMGVFVWINIFTGMLAGPLLYRIFTGEETALTRDIGSLLNRTVLMSSLMIAWCLCDVALEAMCALRRFYGESERTGADLMRAWRRASGRMPKVAALLVFLFCVPACMRAQTAPPETAPDLNRAIDEVLARREYQWRQPSAPRADEDSAIIQWIRSVARSIRRGAQALLRPLRNLWQAFMRWLSGRGTSPPANGPAPPVDALRVASVLVFVLLAGVLVALLLRSRANGRSNVAGMPVSQPLPVDINNPDVSATDLAEEQWLKLAREWMEKGEPRMALRAWFLACLAWLHARDLVTISRNKSNLDYRRELSRRARGNPALTEQFAASVRRFESAWYGDYPLDSSDVENFAADIRRMRSLAG
jgi:hypothetical protein